MVFRYHDVHQNVTASHWAVPFLCVVDCTEPTEPSMDFSASCPLFGADHVTSVSPQVDNWFHSYFCIKLFVYCKGQKFFLPFFDALAYTGKVLTD